MIFYSYLVIFLFSAGLHLFLARKNLSPPRLVEVLLLHLLVVFAGIGGLMGAMAHTWRAAQTAAYIGWPAGSPFQFEVAMANLGLGVLGILCIWLRGRFWTATVFMMAVFLFGAAYQHIMQIINQHNYAPGNAGPVLWLYDLAVPLAMLVLLLLRNRLGKSRAA